ncbi:MAG: hypothetical protein GY859_01070 [Desulfobacterales bacterium]|nr:hypothetical protein [Desulfobacterales bacterium]
MESQRGRDSVFTKRYDTGQARDTGMAMVLICLIVHLVTSSEEAIWAGVGLLAMDMVWPDFFKPVARVWFGLSYSLGTVASKVVLSLLFFLIVTPMGLFRKMLGKDALRLKQWKKGSASVFTTRDHTYRGEDLDAPY